MKTAFLSSALLCLWLTASAGKVDKCATVRCSECRECKLNNKGESRCIYKSGCCPAGQPLVNCFVSPCMPATTQKNCPGAAQCIEDYCGGCNAHYYDKSLNEICIKGSQQAEARVKRGVDHCSEIPCPLGKKCVYSPKQCFTTPCPQYECFVVPVCSSLILNPNNELNRNSSFEYIMIKAAFLSATLVCLWLTTNACKMDKCATVKCTQCHECKLNDNGEPKCIYKSGCCPAGQPLVNCFVSPCMPATTQKNCPDAARCIEDYCGGCNAHYYDKSLNEICTGADKCSEIPCPLGKKCVYSPKQCFTTPCPQYECQ
uniref:Follistatin-like domain-containing protein n=1 Tax=Plectus sambesii TaxID=2011161 RepID=A0A914WLI7_9BILA